MVSVLIAPNFKKALSINWGDLPSTLAGVVRCDGHRATWGAFHRPSGAMPELLSPAQMWCDLVLTSGWLSFMKMVFVFYPSRKTGFSRNFALTHAHNPVWPLHLSPRLPELILGFPCFGIRPESGFQESQKQLAGANAGGLIRPWGGPSHLLSCSWHT